MDQPDEAQGCCSRQNQYAGVDTGSGVRHVWCQPCCPTYVMLIWLLPVFIFITLMTGISGITHPTQYLDLLQDNPGYVLVFGGAYFIVTVMLGFYIITMWRITQLFNKAWVLMSIPSRPLEIIS